MALMRMSSLTASRTFLISDELKMRGGLVSILGWVRGWAGLAETNFS